MGDLIAVVFIVLVATMYSLIFEYLTHKHILHNYRLFKTAFRNHFKVHHGTSRKNGMIDPGYETLVSSRFEVIGLTVIALLHLPVCFLSPLFYFVLIANLAHYYYTHRRSHIDIEWGRENIPWHYAHHMGKNQNINWGVRLPIIDKVLKTSSY